MAYSASFRVNQHPAPVSNGVELDSMKNASSAESVHVTTLQEAVSDATDVVKSPDFRLSQLAGSAAAKPAPQNHQPCHDMDAFVTVLQDEVGQRLPEEDEEAKQVEAARRECPDLSFIDKMLQKFAQLVEHLRNKKIDKDQAEASIIPRCIDVLERADSLSAPDALEELEATLKKVDEMSQAYDLDLADVKTALSNKAATIVKWILSSRAEPEQSTAPDDISSYSFDDLLNNLISITDEQEIIDEQLTGLVDGLLGKAVSEPDNNKKVEMLFAGAEKIKSLRIDSVNLATMADVLNDAAMQIIQQSS